MIEDYTSNGFEEHIHLWEQSASDYLAETFETKWYRAIY